MRVRYFLSLSRESLIISISRSFCLFYSSSWSTSYLRRSWFFFSYLLDLLDSSSFELREVSYCWREVILRVSLSVYSLRLAI